MKLLQFFCIITCMILAIAQFCNADTKPVIEESKNGLINWTSGVVTAVGTGSPLKKSQSKSVLDTSQILQLAKENAVQNLMKTVGEVRIHSAYRVKHLFSENDIVKLKINEMVQKAKELEALRKYMTDHSVECHVHLNLHGALAQLVLPQEIRQIESIKHIMPVKGPSPPTESKKPIEYTGLIVDAIGVKIKPSMTPKLFDENGDEVYGPVYVSREFAVQNGICIYMTDVDAASLDKRVGKNPLIIKALGTHQNSKCDLVISNTDASKILDSSHHLTFLKKCQVIIVVKK